MTNKNNTPTTKLMLNKRTLAAVGGRAVSGHNTGKSMLTTMLTF